MGRTIKLFVVMAMMLALGAGAALAATLVGTAGIDRLLGTNGDDGDMLKRCGLENS